MSIWSDLRAAFLRQPDSKELDPERAMTAGSTAWADLSFFWREQEKFNPDDLIGQKGYGIYKRMMADEQVKAAIQFRRYAVTGRDWYFHLDAEKNGLSEEEAQRRIELCEESIECGYDGQFLDGLNVVMRALWQGMSWSEIMVGDFEYDGKVWYCLKKLRPKPYDTFFPDVNEFGDVLAWKQRQWANGQMKYIDPKKFVYYINAPDMDEHYGLSELRTAYRWWFAKDYVIKFMNVFAERMAGGFVVAKHNAESVASLTEAQKLALQNALSNITGSSSLYLPPGIEADVHYAPGSQVGVFDAIIGIQDLAIAKSLLIPNLLGMSNPKAQTGSYSQGDTQFDVFMVVSTNDADRLAEALNKQVFKGIFAGNFEDGIVPTFAFKPLSESKKMQLLDVWTKLVTGKAVQASDTDEEHVRDLLDFPEKGEPIVDPAVVAAANSPPGRAQPDGGQGPSQQQRHDHAQESIRGVHLVDERTFERAERRVHFTVIGRQSEVEIAKWKLKIDEAIAELVAEGVARIEQERLGSDQRTIEAAGRFDLDGMKTRSVNTQVHRMLQAGMAIGTDHAKREVDAAKSESFSRSIQADRLGDMAAEWLKQKSFTITGDVKAGIVKEIKQVLLSGLKYNWSQKQVTNATYKALVQKGFLSGAAAAEALGLGDTEALAQQLEIQGGLTAARLETVIRTNMFEAINEARFNTFTDPVLKGFVTAFTYSSILDSRTTTICQHMDGRTYSSDAWQGELRPWVPPNHFNCRSLLVPVTTLDEAELDRGLPDVQPQEGFGA